MSWTLQIIQEDGGKSQALPVKRSAVSPILSLKRSFIMRRRDFFKQSALFATAGGLSASLTSSATADEPVMKPNYEKEGASLTKNWGDNPVGHFTSYFPDFADKNLWIRKDNQVLTAYRTGPNQKYPYLYPLIGPVSRVSVTSESAQPWPHHRSVFLGIDRVNGGNYWQAGNEAGQVLSQGLQIVKAEKDKVEFTDRCLWKKPEQDPVFEDQRRYVLQWKNPNYYTLDLYYKMTALTDVEIQKTNHGFFGVRVEQDMAPIGGGNMLSSEGGKSQEETLGKPANWIAFYGKRRFNPAITEGVAVFCPPERFEPFDKCPWFTRDYGNISPMPFLFVEKDYVFKYPKGTVIDKVWRIVVFAGTPADIDLNGLWKEIYG